MRNQKMLISKKYLFRYDEILCEMENKMLSLNVTNNITKIFIECMIPHHQAAIAMSENLLQYTHYNQLQEIAKNIIKTQTIGIEQMKEINETASKFLNYQRNVDLYMTKYFSITEKMINQMKNSTRSININLNFVDEMILHHEGAICMCENLLQYCVDPRLKMVADSIINEQIKGVMQLKEIQRYV